MLETRGTPNSSLGVPEGPPFDLPRDAVPGRLSHLILLRDLPVQESQEVDMPQPAQGFHLQEAVMPQPAWGSST